MTAGSAPLQTRFPIARAAFSVTCDVEEARLFLLSLDRDEAIGELKTMSGQKRKKKNEGKARPNARSYLP